MSSTNPQSFFENRPFRPRIAPKTCRRHGARELLVLDGGLARGWLLGSLAARQCFHCTCRSTGRLACLNCATAALFGCSEETQTTLRRHPCCDAHGRLRDALRREAPERGRRPAIAICPTQPFPTGLQAPGARRWPRLPVPPSLAERMPSLAGTASKEAIHSESQAPGCSAQLS